MKMWTCECEQITGSLCVGTCHNLWCTSNLFWNSFRYADRHMVKNHICTQHKDQTLSKMYITKRTPKIKVTRLSSSPSNLTPPFRFDCKKRDIPQMIQHYLISGFLTANISLSVTQSLSDTSKANLKCTTHTPDQESNANSKPVCSLKLLICFAFLKKGIVYIAYTAYVPLYCSRNVNFLHSALPHLDLQVFVNAIHFINSQLSEA